MKDWSFEEFAQDFDSHVREQLPWYELITKSVAYIARNYLRQYGHVYDIGCSTGNMTSALLPLLEERNATLLGIDNEDSMILAYSRHLTNERIKVAKANAEKYEYHQYDVAIVFLTAMFLPAKSQEDFLLTLYHKMNEGGAIIIVDKVTDDEGYFSTVMKRLTLFWKLENGANPEDILNKELSLSGIQRPLSSQILKNFDAKQFFQLGEFKGWVIEK